MHAGYSRIASALNSGRAGSMEFRNPGVPKLLQSAGGVCGRAKNSKPEFF